MGPLTVDEEGDLPLAHADAGDDGLADVLAGVRLGDRLEVQLVAVAQDLGTVGDIREGTRDGPEARQPGRALNPSPWESQSPFPGGLWEEERAQSHSGDI